MKKTLFSLLLLFCTNQLLLAQQYREHAGQMPVLDSITVKSYVGHFNIKDGKLSGNGAALLIQKINEAQFFVLGERHNSLQTSKLTKALLPHLKKAGYNHFALEVGPNTVKELSAMSTDPARTKERLRSFNTQYYISEINAYPIPFFFGEEDAEFLAEASKLNFKLWGLDQEFFYSIPFFTDKLLALVEGKPNYKKVAELKQQADEQIKIHLLKGKEDEKYVTFKQITEDAAVSTFFDQFSTENKQAQSIINELKVSWDIYNRWRDGSHQDRISYMRNNFLANFKTARVNEKKPKVFVKVGQLHAARNESNGAYDLGDLTDEVARENGTNSTSVNSLPRYYISKDNVATDYLDHPYFSRLKLFLSHGTKKEWTLINLKKIREDIRKGRITLPSNGDYHGLRSQIENYDLLLILPEDQYITPNLDKIN